MDACHCKDYTRAAILRQTAARAGAGAGLRAIEPGMPLPAGTGLSRRSFLARSSGLALAVFGGGRAGAERVRGGHRRRDGRGAREDRARLGLPRRAASTRSRCSRRSTTPAYQALRPTLKLAPEPGARASPATRAAVASRGAAAQDAQRVRPPDRRPGDRLRDAEPVALHVAPLLRGRRAQRGGPGRLARPLAGPQRPRRQPAPGPVDGRDPGARARRGEHARGRRRRRRRTSR